MFLAGGLCEERPTGHTAAIGADNTVASISVHCGKHISGCERDFLRTPTSAMYSTEGLRQARPPVAVSGGFWCLAPVDYSYLESRDKAGKGSSDGTDRDRRGKRPLMIAPAASARGPRP